MDGQQVDSGFLGESNPAILFIMLCTLHFCRIETFSVLWALSGQDDANDGLRGLPTKFSDTDLDICFGGGDVLATIVVLERFSCSIWGDSTKDLVPRVMGDGEPVGDVDVDEELETEFEDDSEALRDSLDVDDVLEDCGEWLLLASFWECFVSCGGIVGETAGEVLEDVGGDKREAP